MTNANGTSTTYSTGDNNQLTGDGVFTYAYDDEGNRLSRTRTSGTSNDHLTEYSWDHRNRLTKVTFKNNAGTVTKTVDYAYDAFNQWVARTVDVDGAQGSTPYERTAFVHDDGQIVLQFDKAGSGAVTAGDLT